MKKKLEFHHCILIIIGILVLDQFLKVYIKLNFPLTIYSDQIIFDYNWFKLLFVENKGMAWGASINDFLPFIDERSAKLILTLFRIVAIGFILFWLKESIKSGLKNMFQWNVPHSTGTRPRCAFGLFFLISADFLTEVLCSIGVLVPAMEFFK